MMLALALGFAPGPAAHAADDLMEHQNITLTRKNGGNVNLWVQVARSGPEQERGLMYRVLIPAGTGMLFPFDPPKEAHFWMKDTLVPLDMLFIAPNHQVVKIAANTTPLSTTPVSSEVPVAYVLEIGGGEAARLRLAAGDILGRVEDAICTLPSGGISLPE